jgi:hypothetical protein
MLSLRLKIKHWLLLIVKLVFWKMIKLWRKVSINKSLFKKLIHLALEKIMILLNQKLEVRERLEMLKYLHIIVCLIWWKALQLWLVPDEIMKNKNFKLILKIQILFLKKRIIQLFFNKNLTLWKLKEKVLHSSSLTHNFFCIKKLISILSVTFINLTFIQKIKL